MNNNASCQYILIELDDITMSPELTIQINYISKTMQKTWNYPKTIQPLEKWETFKQLDWQ